MIIAIICILPNLTGKSYQVVFAYTALITIELPCFLPSQEATKAALWDAVRL